MIECFMHDLMSHPCRNWKTVFAESNVNCQGLIQDVSEGRYIISWHRDHFYDILAMNVPGFHPGLKNLPGAKLKTLGLLLAKEMSRQHRIDFLET